MYTNDPKQAKVRRDAALFAQQHGVRCAARRYGVSPGTVTKWCQKAKQIGVHPIPTHSSRPRSHPATLSVEITNLIVSIRFEHNRSAEVVHKRLKDEHGIEISLSSVKRTLDRRGLLNKRSPWKRYHPPQPRPPAQSPGSLVQMDTIHLMQTKIERMYVFTCLDVYSRWAWARAYPKIGAGIGIRFFHYAQKQAPFVFQTIQSDHGPEFSTHFTERIPSLHRHSRVRKPNDNAHLERFNRTIQTELISSLRPDPIIINKALPDYLKWYNEERHHFGLNLETPLSTIRCFQGID
jgi:transposase InsO family protein